MAGWPRPCATLAASVAAMPKPSSHRASTGTGALRRAESSITIDSHIDQPVHRQRDQAAGPARLTMHPHQIVGMLVRCDSSDADHTPAVVHLITLSPPFIGHHRPQTTWSARYR